jgi:hypothetical protein
MKEWIMSDSWRGEFPLGGSGDGLAVGANADGRLELFYVGTNSNLYHNWQTAPNSLFWAGEVHFAGNSAKQIAVARNADGRQEIFYVGTNNDLYHNWQTAPNSEVWAGETRFANNSAKQIAVGQNLDGRLEIFYVGTNDNLYHNWQTAPNSQVWAGETWFRGNSAKQVAVGRNADGRLEIFYVGTNNDLYHNHQTAPNGNGWAGETHFANNSAKLVAVGQNQDGRLEIFYVGTNNDLYHNWQTAPNSELWAGETHIADNSAQQIAVGRNTDGTLEIIYVGTNVGLYRNRQSAANSLTWNGETRFGDNSALQVDVRANADGRLEIFYVGTNFDIYHNWQTPSPSGFGSNSNQILFSSCKPLQGVSVTIAVTEEIVCRAASGPTKGFSFQLNAYSPKNEKSAWQQYIISLFGNTVVGAVDNWPLIGDNIINDFFNLVSLPTKGIPSGYVLQMTLHNDTKNNITGATFVVKDDQGRTIANVVKVLTDISGVSSADIAPIIAFELNLVGPVNSESAVLSSGAGTITYQAITPLAALNSEPSCAESGYVTAETANSLYSLMPATTSTQLLQKFSITSNEFLVVHKEGKLRPGLVIPPGILKQLH